MGKKKGGKKGKDKAAKGGSILPGKMRVTAASLDECVRLLQSVPVEKKDEFKSCVLFIENLETASALFLNIGLELLDCLRHIRLTTDQTVIEQHPGQVVVVLQMLASCAPARRVEHLDLKFSRKPPVGFVIDGSRVACPCFALHGFMSVNVSIVVKPYEDTRGTADEIMSTFLLALDPGPRVNFLERLPPELREMTYEYLVPQRCRLPYHWTLVFVHDDLMVPVTFRSLLLVNRQLGAEVLAKVAKTCKFECIIYPAALHGIGHFGEISPRSLLNNFLVRLNRRKVPPPKMIRLRIDVFESDGIDCPLTPVIKRLALKRGQTYGSGGSTLKYISSAPIRFLGGWNRYWYTYALPVIDGLQLTLLVCFYAPVLPHGEIGTHQDKYLGMITKLLKLNLDGYRTAIGRNGRIRNLGFFEDEA